MPPSHESVLEDTRKRARAYLQSKQQDDGKWIDFDLEVGRSTAWITAYVASAPAS